MAQSEQSIKEKAIELKLREVIEEMTKRETELVEQLDQLKQEKKERKRSIIEERRFKRSVLCTVGKVPPDM